MAQNGPQMASRWPQMPKNGPQDGPKMAQDGPRWSPDGPKMGQDARDDPQDGSKRVCPFHGFSVHLKNIKSHLDGYLLEGGPLDFDHFRPGCMCISLNKFDT